MECPRCVEHLDRPFTAYFLPSSSICPACRGERQPKHCDIKETLKRFMQRLTAAPSPLSGTSVRSLCHECAQELQRKMRKGTQEKADFNEYAAWGYVSAKFAQRAEMSYEATRGGFLLKTCIHTRNVSSRHVISLGGGPGNDLFGAMVAMEEHALVSTSGLSAEKLDDIKYFCFDWVEDVWRPIVLKVGSLCNRDIVVGHCDLTLPLSDVENEEVLSAIHGDTCLFLLSFVILESSAVLANELIETCPRSTFVILDAGQGHNVRQSKNVIDFGEKPFDRSGSLYDGKDSNADADSGAQANDDDDDDDRSGARRDGGTTHSNDGLGLGGSSILCGSLSQFASQEYGRDVQLLYHRDELVGVLLPPVTSLSSLG